MWLAYACNTNPTKSCKLAACCLLRLIPRWSIIWLVKPFLLFFVSWCNSHEKRYQGLSCFTELQSDKAGWGLGTREERCLSVQCLPHTPAHDAHNTPLMPHTLTTFIYHPPPPTHTPLSPSHTGLSGKSLSSMATWSGNVEITPGYKRCLPQDQSQGGVDK